MGRNRGKSILKENSPNSQVYFLTLSNQMDHKTNNQVLFLDTTLQILHQLR